MNIYKKIDVYVTLTYLKIYIYLLFCRASAETILTCWVRLGDYACTTPNKKKYRYMAMCIVSLCVIQTTTY